jgi:heterodisulfide reductase subunit A-like polyferredoxin
MNARIFVCTTPLEKEADLQDLGSSLSGMGYEVHSGAELCSPRGQLSMRERTGGADQVVLVCSRSLGREVFEGALPPHAEFSSRDMQGEPRELASLIHEEIARVLTAEALEPALLQEVLIIGGGVGGVYAALDLAEQGHKVFLVEKDPSIGGIMAALDKTFPTMDCSI